MLQFQFQSQMSRPSCFEFMTAILGLMQKRALPCWLQLRTLGSYHPRPLRDAHSSHRILCVRRAPRQSLRLVPTNIHHNTVLVWLQQLAFLVPTLRPTRWQQSVSTARRRRRRCRNYRRVGWAVAHRSIYFNICMKFVILPVWPLKF